MLGCVLVYLCSYIQGTDGWLKDDPSRYLHAIVLVTCKTYSLKPAFEVRLLNTLMWSAQRTLDPQLCSHATPQTATLGLNPIIHVPNYMDYYSFTDPWGMDSWVHMTSSCIVYHS